MSTSSDDDSWNARNKDLSKDYVYRMQNERFEVFKEQDLEKGDFDVKFDIGGKIIYANKFILKPISETMNAWLSERWTTKDAPIKIESYSYDNFHQFLCFVYSGNCDVTDENVFQLVDMAEFFGVPCLKEFCDQFLYDMKKKAETIEELYEFADKYSLQKCINSVKHFVSRHSRLVMLNAEEVHEYKKPFIEFLSTIDRMDDYVFDFDDSDSDSDYEEFYYSRHVITMNKKESQFFEYIYKWAEQRVNKSKPVDDEHFNLQEAIKIELESILPNIKFYKMNHNFLMAFVVEKGFILSPTELREWFKKFRARRQSVKEEDIFKSVYELAEKQALQKQATSSDPDNFNLADSIKADLAEVIPRVEFHKMEEAFLNEYVVAKGIMTSEQANHVRDTYVELKNYGNIISGVFKDDVIGIQKALEKKPAFVRRGSGKKYRFLKLKFSVPKTSSTVKKMKGVEWYLCLEDDGILTFKHHSKIDRRDYLIAEMKRDTEFKLVPNALTFLTVSPRNVFDL